jgi:methylmalonyl-CoA mutase N-terminal domain/subunit
MFTDSGDDEPLSILQIDPVVEERQLKRLAGVKSDRDGEAVRRTLDAVRRDAAEPDANLMPPILDAVRAFATIGEIVGALGEVFGRWAETPVI